VTKYEPYEPTKWEKRIDALFGLVSTKAALNRMVNREKMNWFRYLAAQPTSARRNAPYTTAGEWLKVQREKLQIMWNAIMMVDNSGLCTGILTKFPTYVCGTLSWQARTGDKSVNDQYEAFIKQKCGKPGNIDISRRYTLRQMCMLDIKSIALKGDVGTNIVRQDDEIYLQGIEADRIGDPYKWVTNEKYVRGLDLDDVGGITGYHIFHQDRLTGYYKFDDVYPALTKKGLPNFLFFTNPIDYDNYRGVSLFKHAIDNSTYIDRMRQYELQALLWAASQSGVYYTRSGSLPEQLPFDKQPYTDSQGNQVNVFETRPNTISALSADGEKVEMFQHDRPSPNVIGMYENTVRDIAIGAGLTYGFCYNMTGLTGPAVRQCSAQDARAIQVWQEMLREQKLDPVIMLLLGDAIAKGELPYHKNWMRWEWFFPAKPTIDVGRESQANIEELNACINTGANIAAEGGIGDIGEVITQRSNEIKMLIEAAQDVADELGLEWEQVYQMLVPPQKGRGGGMGGAGGPFGGGMGGGGGLGDRDGQGASSNGADLGGEEEFSLKKNGSKKLPCVLVTPEGDLELFYNPDQLRDYAGRFQDEGKGSDEPGYQHPGVADLQGLDKKLVDYNLGRPLARGAKGVKSIGHYVPDMHYVMYTKTPFFAALNKLQGTPDPENMKVEDFAAARKAFFEKQPVEKLAIKDLIATQPVINNKKIKKNVKNEHVKNASVVKYGDKYFIMDGHHAVATAATLGYKHIDANVVEIPEVPEAAGQFVRKLHPSWSEADYKAVKQEPALSKLEPPADHTAIPPAANMEDMPRYVSDFKASPEYDKAMQETLGSLPKNASYYQIEDATLDKHKHNGRLDKDRAILHEQIVNHYFNPKAAAKPGQRPSLVLLMGQPGAGKTTAGAPYARKYGEMTELDPDGIRSFLPEYNGYNAPATQNEAKLIGDRMLLPRAVKARHSILVDQTGANGDKVARLTNNLGKLGYDVHIIYVKAPLWKSANNIVQRFQKHGRFVDPDYLVDHVDGRPGNTYDRMKKNKYVKSWVTLDNSADKAIVTDEGKR